jgi:hypothetical protein
MRGASSRKGLSFGVSSGLTSPKAVNVKPDIESKEKFEVSDFTPMSEEEFKDTFEKIINKIKNKK